MSRRSILTLQNFPSTMITRKLAAALPKSDPKISFSGTVTRVLERACVGGVRSQPHSKLVHRDGTKVDGATDEIKLGVLGEVNLEGLMGGAKTTSSMTRLVRVALC